MSLQMLTNDQFMALKCQAVGEGTRRTATVDLVSTTETPGGRLTDISLIEPQGIKRIDDITGYLSLSVRHILPAQLAKLVGKPVEVVYDEIERKRLNPPTIYGKVVAMRCGNTILHDFFQY